MGTITDIATIATSLLSLFNQPKSEIIKGIIQATSFHKTEERNYRKKFRKLRRKGFTEEEKQELKDLRFDIDELKDIIKDLLRSIVKK